MCNRDFTNSKQKCSGGGKTTFLFHFLHRDNKGKTKNFQVGVAFFWVKGKTTEGMGGLIWSADFFWMAISSNLKTWLLIVNLSLASLTRQVHLRSL